MKLERRIFLGDDSLAATAESGIFGVSCTYEDANLVIVPVPWEATVSYRGGTAGGPDAILAASHQVDLYSSAFGKIFEYGIHLLPPAQGVADWNLSAREATLSKSKYESKAAAVICQKVDELSEKMNRWVHHSAREALEAGKIPVVIGGDHSTPLGLIRALSESYHSDGFGILHFDAHFDLRKAYEGFTYSHASIMYNVIEQCKNVKTLVQVGIRDFCYDEIEYASQSQKIKPFLARDLFNSKAEGKSFNKIADEIVGNLPEKVYVSFDIDGLDPLYCPSTGTPVPGGLSYDEATYIIERLANSGRHIIGFDLNEVAPSSRPGDEWDANVGARLLYQMCGALFQSWEKK